MTGFNLDAPPDKISGVKLIQGDCLQTIKGLRAGSVHCIVTSPPYFGLRDYGTANWEGGDPDCDHSPASLGSIASSTLTGGKSGTGACGNQQGGFRGTCRKCGATRVDDQIGLEETPDAYIAKMVALGRELRRVLRDDGVYFLNLGDSYSGNAGKGKSGPGKNTDYLGGAEGTLQTRATTNYLPSGNLLGIPWRVALALQADGWIFRSDIIWHATNKMPESVTNRPSKAHEYIFMFVKKRGYYYDAEAVKEETTESYASGGRHRLPDKVNGPGYEIRSSLHNQPAAEYRNKRTVWCVSVGSVKEAHFACYPPKLIEPCILAGTSAAGACPHCSAPYKRIVEKDRQATRPGTNTKVSAAGQSGGAYNPPGQSAHSNARLAPNITGNRDPERHVTATKTVGWAAGCDCNAGAPVPCVVLDPFGGAGTTSVVCLQNGRRSILLELNPDYIEIQKRRLWKTYNGEKAVKARAAFRELADKCNTLS